MRTIYHGKWLYDGEHVVEAYEMTVENGLIVSVTKQTQTPDVVLEGYVIPGLIDAHCHLMITDGITSIDSAFTVLEGYDNSLKMLRDGFVAIRDLGSPKGYAIGIKRFINEGHIGPEIISAGQALRITGGHGNDISIVCDGVQAIQKGVRSQIESNVDWIKIMASGGVNSRGQEPGPPEMTLEEIKMAVETAHNFKRYVSAHTQGYTAMKYCVEAGVKSLEHCVFLEEDIHQDLIKNDVFLVPTFSAPYHASLVGLKENPNDKAHQASKSVIDLHRSNILKAYKAGVNVVLGTDVGTPYNEHGKGSYELCLMVEAGFTAEEAVKTATIDAAKQLELNHLGELKAGFEASFVILDEHPFKTIESITKDKLVYKKGKLVEEIR
jgi:imidazolonepropionase-like amidohydrolase